MGSSSSVRPFRRFLPYAILIAAVIVPLWQLTLMQGVFVTDDIFTSDLMNDGLPYRTFLGESLRQGEFPLWYPPVYGGLPLIARAESGICFPPTILLFWLLPPYHALNVLVLFTFLTAAIGMFLYARELSSSVPGALVAGIAFAWSGFMVCHMKHLSMVGSASLFPLGLLGIERAMGGTEKHRMHASLLLLALVFGLQILAGHIQVAYYSALAYITYALVRWVQTDGHERKKSQRKHEHQRTARFQRLAIKTPMLFVLALMLGGGIGSVQLLPTYELVHQGQRAGGVDFQYASKYSYDPANVVTFLVPYAYGDVSDDSYRGRGVFWEDYGYIGITSFLLACAGLITARSQGPVKLLGWLALGAFLMVLGPNTPFFEAAFRALPGMQYFRFPGRFLFLVDASLAVLSAFGVRWLLEKVQPALSGRSRLLMVVIVATCAADVVLCNLRQNPVAAMGDWEKIPQTAAWLQRDTTEYRIYTPGSSETHTAAFALARGWSGGVQPYVAQREFLQPSTNVLYGIACADGYAQLTPEHVVDIWGDQNKKGGAIFATAAVHEGVFVPSQAFVNILSVANVKYVLSPWPIKDSLMHKATKIGPVFITRNPSVLPRAHLVDTAIVVNTPAEAVGVLMSEDFEPRTQAIISLRCDLGGLRSQDTSTATIISASSNQLAVRTTSGRPRLLVVADTDYPGWRATVDGQEVPILRANVFQRAVVVPAGDHTVHFRFESASIYWGFAFSIVCCTILLVGWFVARRGKVQLG
jgi:hypothetical protein